ncbi:MAG: hypothetical protein ACUVRK_05040 [Spirochaetota bacterium]
MLQNTIHTMQRLIPFIIISTLIISCKGNAFKNITQHPNKVSNTIEDTVTLSEIYVSPYGSDLYGDGTRNNPFATINYALSIAHVHNATTIYVAIGTYSITDVDGIRITKNIMLLGGYDPRTWQRYPYKENNDRQQYQTVLQYEGSSNGMSTMPVATLSLRGNSVTSETVIEGFIIHAKHNGQYCAAIFIFDDASPTIRYNTINGSNTATIRSYALYSYFAHPIILSNYIDGKNAGYTYAIYTSNSDVTIEHNIIIGGSAHTGNSYGILTIYATGAIYGNQIHGGSSDSNSSYAIYNNSSSISIYNNDIHGGTGTMAYGVYNCTASSPSIYNNVIYAGDATAFRSFGIFCVNANTMPRIYNNTIHHGTHADNSQLLSGSFGIYISDSNAHPDIKNNILFGNGGSKGYGLYMATNTGSFSELKHNNFYSVETLLARQNGTTITTYTIDEINNLSNAENNYTDNPQFMDEHAFDLHLSNNTPTTIQTGGCNLSMYYTYDKDNIYRSNWSIGAYEYN